MVIFFSPSEAKARPTNPKFSANHLQEELEEEILEYIKNYLFSLKNESLSIIEKILSSKDIGLLALCQNLFFTKRIPAFSLYQGVAYKALDFENLSEEQKSFLQQSTYIFSNLFGPVQASFKLPFYKLNQNFKSKTLGLNLLYRRLNEKLAHKFYEEEVLDLRAEAYKKIFIGGKKILIPTFVKNQRTLSHSSKYYRGLYLREVAKNFYAKNPKNLDSLLDFKPEGLRVCKMEEKSLKSKNIHPAGQIIEIFYEIL